MHRVFNQSEPPQDLLRYLGSSLEANDRCLRRRAVFSRQGTGGWVLICCTTEALPERNSGDKPSATRRYPEAVLFEDWLTPDECRQFIDNTQSGKLAFEDIVIERQGTANWHCERLPLKSDFMVRAGLHVTTRFQGRPAGVTQGPLIAPEEPYYPDLYEAAKHWLPLPVYHGHSDARNQEILFLLPEIHAFFTDAKLGDGALELSVGGTDIERTQLVVKGAYWTDDGLQHFENVVKDGKVIVAVPNHVNRLEYVLVDADGALRDFQREDRFGHSGLGTKRLDSAAQNLAQQVLNACRDGEGMNNEFKPFISQTDNMGPKDKKTKFREVVTTTVAFANTQGGCIYLGVDDECTLSGVTDELRKWVKGDVTEEVTRRYCGALTSRLKDQILGDVPLRVSHVTVNGALVIVIEVSSSPARPVRIRDDNLFYVRAGASNKQLPPEAWESFLGRQSNDGVFRFNTG
jgi:hypothetical protein